MQSGSIAKRYSRAFIELAQESGTTDTVLREMSDFCDKLNGSPMLKTAMINPSFVTDQRVAVLKELMQALNYSPLTHRFLTQLALKRRLDVVEAVVHEFRNYYDDLRGLVRVSVTTATPLSAEQDAQLITQVEALTGRKAVVTRHVDPKVIGGIVTRINDLLIDGSVATQLQRIRGTLLREKAEAKAV